MPPVKVSRRRFIVYTLISGLCAGYAAITNYIVAIVVAILGCYALFALRPTRAWLWFGIGALGPLLLICIYNQVCFGTPFTTNYHYQNPRFISGSKAFLDVFITPWTFDGSVLTYVREVFSVLITVLISPFRGLFFRCSCAPRRCVWHFRIIPPKKSRRGSMGHFIGLCFSSSCLFVSSTDGRVDGRMGRVILCLLLPFLIAPAVFGFMRFPKISVVLMIISVGIQFLTTAVESRLSLVPLLAICGALLWVNFTMVRKLEPARQPAPKLRTRTAARRR
jgi:hypothetical protein